MLNLKQKRIENNLKQRDIAEALQKTVTCICDWERGRTQPSIEDIVALANYFQCSVDELLGREDYGTGNVVVQGATLTEDEKQLLELYRALPIRDKAELVGFAKGLAF